MSRQNKKPRLAIVPDEISGPPGKAEAKEILALFDLANKGMRAFVMMGFRLISVKARLPHGQYMHWMEKHLKGLSRFQLHRSRQIAEGIAIRLGWDAQMLHARTFETDLPPEVCDLIDGKSGRALLSELRDFTEDTEDVACRQLCEARWAIDPLERDDWQPRVLSGEMTYHRAYIGMLGADATEGKAKKVREVWRVFDGKLTALKSPFRGLESLISENQKNRELLKKHVAGWARMDMSEDMRRIWLEAMEESLIEKGVRDV